MRIPARVDDGSDKPIHEGREVNRTKTPGLSSMRTGHNLV